MKERDKNSLSFPKDGRLHHRSLVEGLFRLGKSFYEFPFRIFWRVLTPAELELNFRNNVPAGVGNVQMMISVPKKKRRRAVDRVQMRRRIREAYRLNRRKLMELVENKADIGTLSIGIVYIHDQNLPYASVEEKVKNILLKIQSRLTKNELQ